MLSALGPKARVVCFPASVLSLHLVYFVRHSQSHTHIQREKYIRLCLRTRDSDPAVEQRLAEVILQLEGTYSHQTHDLPAI